MAEKTKKPLLYKGKPLVRNGNLVYYGDMAEPYVAMLQIHDTADFADLHLPSRVTVQILATDEDLPLKDRLKNRTEKNSFYDAMNIASIWLERILAGGEA
jgi:hypothetical protein